ncbi:translation initiation factor IF-2 [Candidatus Cytomitobacter primus]|uniref:Translation initiation factor IF-2 n=1 Tax=Candidatus Cytomitobacter primus TaxID=2066024 RepID=A0A5C0UFN5_9PROT|nr:translation initiation factor IF-2 [Candidatus Cytomitobacter primus]QEK38491.1 translation initiation factor IF-2 [Candidatus Cytomitobacter primus]
MNYTVNDRNNKKVPVVKVRGKASKTIRTDIGKSSSNLSTLEKQARGKALQNNFNDTLPRSGVNNFKSAGSSSSNPSNRLGKPSYSRPDRPVYNRAEKPTPYKNALHDRKVVINEKANKENIAKRELLQNTISGNQLNPLNKILQNNDQKKEFRTYNPQNNSDAPRRFNKFGQDANRGFRSDRPGGFNRFGGDRPNFGSRPDGQSRPGGFNKFGGDRPSFGNRSDEQSRPGGFNRFGSRPDGQSRPGGFNRFGSRPDGQSRPGGFNRFGSRPDGQSGGFNKFGNRNDGRPSRPGFSDNKFNSFKPFPKARPFMSKPGEGKPFNKPFSTPFGSNSFNSKPSSFGAENRKSFGVKRKFSKSDSYGDKRQNRFRNESNESNERFSHQFLGKINSADDVEIYNSNSYFQKKNRNVAKARDTAVRHVVIPFEGIDPVSLASKIAVKINFLHSKLVELDLPKSSLIDPEIALAIIEETGHTGEIAKKEMDIVPDQGNPEDYAPRCPVVTIVGHVDHGKTSLLDALRKTNVVSGESGGITQSIGASQVFLDKKRFVTFVDTPGHEAFTSMRIRGVEITDVVILVIAADDGIKDQTVEAIQHIKNADVPFIICYTKIDKNVNNIDSIRQKLLIHSVMVESLGGDVLEVEVSAMQNKNLDKLLEILLLQAEMLELKANNKCKASGIVIESNLDKHKGPIATILMKNGTLNYSDNFIVGNTYGKVRAMTLPNKDKVKEVTASIPVEIMGLNDIPNPGDMLIEVSSDKEARSISEYRLGIENRVAVPKKEIDILAYFNEEQAEKINLLVKADVAGSLEAIVAAISKIEYENIEINVVGKGNGAISESDVLLAKTSKSTIISFKVNAPSAITSIAQQHDVKIKKFSVIYELLDYIKSVAEGILAPTEEEEILGTATIKAIFVKKKLGTIAGCGVDEGIMKIKTKGRVIRNGKEIYTGDILSLKQRQYDKKEIPANQECGIIIDGFTDFHIGDTIESFIIKELEKPNPDA